MMRPYRVRRRNACRPTNTSAAIAISTQRSFGIDAPSTLVVSLSQGGVTYTRGPGPQIAVTSAVSASASPTVTSTCSMWRW